MSLDDEWLAFLENKEDFEESITPSNRSEQNNNTLLSNQSSIELGKEECNEVENITPSELYISTKTKIIYLNKPIDIYDIFWKIPVMKYGTKSNCVIKKQVKIHSVSQANLDDILNNIEEHRNKGLHIEETILHNAKTQNPNKNCEFKDVRKVSIGLSRKDILSQRSKKECFLQLFCIDCETLV